MAEPLTFWDGCALRALLLGYRLDPGRRRGYVQASLQGDPDRVFGTGKRLFARLVRLGLIDQDGRLTEAGSEALTP